MATSDSGQQGDAVRVRLLGLQISYRKIKAKSWHSTRLQREHKCSHTHTLIKAQKKMTEFPRWKGDLELLSNSRPDFYMIGDVMSSHSLLELGDLGYSRGLDNSENES